MWLLGLGIAVAAGATDEVARGWYLWRTGQDEEALTLARELARKEPQSMRARALDIAMGVAASEGASVEAAYREWWGEAPSDPIRRTLLAYAITLRRPAPGAWCEEVATLVTPVVEGEARAMAWLADRERERRCTGKTGHADAALRSLVKDSGPGWVDGVLAEMDAGYIKSELPDKLEKALAEQPERVDRVGSLWRKEVTGPAKAAARGVANRALDAALASDDPVLVHAALVAYRQAEQTKKVEQATLKLEQLDPGADPSLVRSISTLADPEIYARIDACPQLGDLAQAAECLSGLLTDSAVAASGAVRAHAQLQRRLVLEALLRDDEAYQAAQAAYEADPTHRFNARSFVRLTLARASAQPPAAGAPPLDLELATEAADAVLFGRTAGGELTADQKSALARDLEARGRLLALTGRPEEALADLLEADRLAPNPERRLRVGIALAESGRGDEAGIVLAHALAGPASGDTALVTRAREALGKLAAGWDPGGMQAMIAAAGRKPGDKLPAHPLVGKTLTDAALLPTPDADAPQAPSVGVLFVWASWSPDSLAALERVGALAERYRERGVRVVVLGVDAEPPATPPEELAQLGVESRAVGPAAMRQLQSVALPTVVVVDGKGTVRAALSPYDRGSLTLEEILDGMLPKP
jgi:tetratricopeptide (TPR) repeat protein